MRQLALGGLLLVACSSDGDATVEAGGGHDSNTRAFEGDGPALEDCYAGYAFAECGGHGQPRIGCRLPAATEGAVPACMWFTGGTVAKGFVASGCEGDPCCAREDGGGWPFSAADELVGDF